MNQVIGDFLADYPFGFDLDGDMNFDKLFTFLAHPALTMDDLQPTCIYCQSDGFAIRWKLTQIKF